MAERSRFLDIYNYRMNEFAANIDTKSANAGAARGLFIFLPYVFLVSLFEYLYKRIIRKG
jgi:hypothetical protein